MRRWIITSLAGMALVVSSLLVPLGASTGVSGASTGNLSDAELAAAGAPPCPTGWSCLPMPCPTPTHCGIVEAGPTSNLGPGQWVYLKLYGFAPGQSVHYFYCQDSGGPTPSPLCAYDTAQMPYPTPIVQSGSDGTSQFAFQTVLADSSGGASSALHGVNELTSATQGFWCDTSGSNNCSIDVVDPALTGAPTPAPQAGDTLVVPIGFSPPTGICSSAAQVQSEGEFGADVLLSATDPLTCAKNGASATIPFNTSLDGLAGLNALKAGSIQMAFTDDPQAASQQAIIKDQQFLLIPLAYSANVVAFRSEVANGSVVVPQSALNLSANMVAGLLTGGYNQWQNADPTPCTRGLCPGLAFLNYQGPQFSQGHFYGAFVRSDSAGTTDQLFSWLCASPAMSLDFAALGASGTESQSGEEVLKQYLFSQGGAPSGCLATDQFPPLIQSNWASLSTPSQQSLKLSQFVIPPGATNDPFGGFSSMNWAEGVYYGMSFAGLQNAASKFVEPSPASVSSGIADGSWDANGMWTPSYSDSADAGAYAMPTVLYAAVPRAANISATDKTQIKDALNQILDVTTGSSASTQLPNGLIPLSSPVATMARDEVALGVGNPSYLAPKPGSTTPVSSSSAFGSSFAANGSFSSALGSLGATSSTAASGGARSVPTPSSSPTYGAFALTASESRLLLPLASLLGLGLFIFGVVMMTTGGLRRRRPAGPGADEAAAAAEGEGP